MAQDIDLIKKLDIPHWCTVLDFWIPLTLASISGLFVWLALVGLVAVPTALGPLAWAPVLFSQLDKLPALIVLMTATSMVACTVGGFCAFFSRALFTHGYYKDKAAEGKTTAITLEVATQIKDAQVEKRLTRLEDMLYAFEEKTDNLIGAVKVINYQPTKSTLDNKIPLKSSNDALSSSVDETPRRSGRKKSH
jgi:hypothetical protein